MLNTEQKLIGVSVSIWIYWKIVLEIYKLW